MTPAEGGKAASGLPCGSALASGGEENAGAAGAAQRRTSAPARSQARQKTCPPPPPARALRARRSKLLLIRRLPPHTPHTKPLREPAGATAGHVLPTPPRPPQRPAVRRVQGAGRVPEGQSRPIFYSLPRRRCYGRHGVDRPASRHAGLRSLLPRPPQRSMEARPCPSQ